MILLMRNVECGKSKAEDGRRKAEVLRPEGRETRHSSLVTRHSIRLGPRRLHDLRELLDLAVEELRELRGGVADRLGALALDPRLHVRVLSAFHGFGVQL